VSCCVKLRPAASTSELGIKRLCKLNVHSTIAVVKPVIFKPSTKPWHNASCASVSLRMIWPSETCISASPLTSTTSSSKTVVEVDVDEDSEL